MVALLLLASACGGREAGIAELRPLAGLFAVREARAQCGLAEVPADALGASGRRWVAFRAEQLGRAQLIGHSGTRASCVAWLASPSFEASLGADSSDRDRVPALLQSDPWLMPDGRGGARATGSSRLCIGSRPCRPATVTDQLTAIASDRFRFERRATIEGRCVAGIVVELQRVGESPP